MDPSNQIIEADDAERIDLEKGPLKFVKKPPNTTSPNTTHSSATAVAQSQSMISGRSKWREYVERILYRLSHCRAVEAEPSDNVEEELELRDPTKITRTLDSCPEGYPQLGAFLDSDENFMLYRRFGYLQSRILLHKQDELRALETELDIMDRADNENRATRRYLKSRDMDDKRKDSPRKALIMKIEIKFKEYAELLAIAQAIVAMNKPAKRDYTSVKNYFIDEAPLNAADEYYIYHKEDIITLKPGRENAWLDGMIERVLQKLSCPLIKYIFRSPETRNKWRAGNVVYYTQSRIDTLVTLIITTVILILMVLPVYVLWHLSTMSSSSSSGDPSQMQTQAQGPDVRATIGVLLLFTLVFSAVLSFFTRARRHEIFGAAAAYCAVLVVFISNVGQVAGQVSVTNTAN